MIYPDLQKHRIKFQQYITEWTLSFTAERARRTSDCAHWGGLSNVYQVMFNKKSSEWTVSW